MTDEVSDEAIAVAPHPDAPDTDEAAAHIGPIASDDPADDAAVADRLDVPESDVPSFAKADAEREETEEAGANGDPDDPGSDAASQADTRDLTDVPTDVPVTRALDAPVADPTLYSDSGPPNRASAIGVPLDSDSRERASGLDQTSLANLKPAVNFETGAVVPG